jgi:hypothetical protein
VEPPDYRFDRDPLPRGQSFPLKRSLLDAALARAGVTCVASVYFRRGSRSLDVDLDPDPWLSPGIVASYQGIYPYRRGRHDVFSLAKPGTVELRVPSVPSPERRRAGELLAGWALPRVVDWLGRVESRPPTWRERTHWFAALLCRGKLACCEDEGVTWVDLPSEAEAEAGTAGTSPTA